MEELTHYFARDHRKARRWAIGIAVAALVAAGGGFAAADLAGGTAAGAPAVPASLTVQGSELNAALNSAAATGTPHCRRALARLRRLPGMYGQFSVRTKEHGTRTIAFERGVITAAGGGVTVRAANGTEWTWQFTGHTVVREGRSKASRSNLADGQHVFVGGPLTGSTRDARLILIARGTHAAPRATPSPSTSGSPATGTGSTPTS